MGSSTDENRKHAWDAVIRELVANGEVSEDVLYDSDVIIRWWRSLDPTKQEEIKSRVEELSRGIFAEVPGKKAGLEAPSEAKREQAPKKRKSGGSGYLGWILAFIIIVVAINLSSSGDTTQSPTEQTTEATTTYNGISVYHNRQPNYYGANYLVPVSLSNNVTAENPTWEELVTFLELDDTDEDMYIRGVRVCAEFANTLHNNAEKAGIRTAFITLQFDDDSEGHALNAFETTDKGLVFVDSSGSGFILSISLASIQAETAVTESFASESNDRIAYVRVGREYGLVSLAAASSPEYEFYLQYLQKTKDFDVKMDVLNTRIEEFNQKMEQYNRDVERYDLLIGGRTAISDPEEYERLSNLYDDLERRSLELDGEDQHLEQEQELLRRELSELGFRTWDPMGIVESIEIYW